VPTPASTPAGGIAISAAKETPMPCYAALPRWLARAAALGLMAALLFAVPPALADAPATALAAPPAGYGRIWIYRYYEPYESLATPYVRFNGRIVAVSQPGGSFYRDVPAGTYHVTVDSQGRDTDQFTTVAVVPGQTVYVQVQVSRYWDCGGGGGNRAGGGGWCRPTFYPRLQLPQVAEAAIAHMPFYGGG
jgi:hypothetical protein